MTLKKRVEEFLAQKRIAVAGVSSNREDAANAIYRKLRDAGYEAFPVNPNAAEFEGATCYPSVKAIPGGVDGIVIVTRPEITEQIVKDCAEAGVNWVWMHDNTFAEGSVSDVAVDYCREHHINVIPGMCPMMYCQPDFGHKCMRWVIGLMRRIPQ